jgi:hypothetical protein
VKDYNREKALKVVHDALMGEAANGPKATADLIRDWTADDAEKVIDALDRAGLLLTDDRSNEITGEAYGSGLHDGAGADD